MSRITTTAVTAEGQAKKTVEETRTTASGGTTKTTTVTVQGTVQTDRRARVSRGPRRRQPVTYKIQENATMPADLAVGKVVTIRSVTGGAQTIIVEKN